jgi:hypothetical protein
MMSSSDVYTNNGRDAGWIPAEFPLPKITEENNRSIQHVKVDSTTDAPTFSETINNGVKSTVNSSTDNLLADAPFTGTGEDVTEYAVIMVAINSDQESAADGLELQFKDGGDWVTTDEYTYKATGVTKTYSIQPVMPMFRVKYTNGSVAQNSFDLCVQYKKHGGVNTSHRVADTISGQDDAALTKTILMAEQAGGTTDVYANIQATAAGNLKVSVEELIEGASVPIIFGSESWFLFSEFGELRATNPANRSDTEFLFDTQPLLYDDVSSTDGVVTHQANSRDLLMTLSTTDPTAKAGVRKHYYVPYTPGSGQEIDLTGTLDDGGVGGGTAALFVRSNVSGTVSETVVAQSAWDTPSTDVDWGFSQIFRMSFQSLKVGRIQYSLVRDGVPIKVHEITNDNVRNTGYWQFATLPPYACVYNTTDGNSVSEIGYGDTDNGIGFRYTLAASTDLQMRYICETVKTQGGAEILDMPGYEFSASRGSTAKTVSTTDVAVISLRVADTFNSIKNTALYIPTGFDISTNNSVYYEIIYRGTPSTDVSWTAVDATYSGMEYDVTANSVTGGIVVDSGYVSTARNISDQASGLLERVIMARGHLGTPDILTLKMRRAGGQDASVFASFKWKEIR